MTYTSYALERPAAYGLANFKFAVLTRRALVVQGRRPKERNYLQYAAYGRCE